MNKIKFPDFLFGSNCSFRPLFNSNILFSVKTFYFRMGHSLSRDKTNYANFSFFVYLDTARFITHNHYSVYMKGIMKQDLLYTNVDQ